MLTLLQISDLHVGLPFLAKVGDALLRIAPELAADVIIVSGDLTPPRHIRTVSGSEGVLGTTSASPASRDSW